MKNGADTMTKKPPEPLRHMLIMNAAEGSPWLRYAVAIAIVIAAAAVRWVFLGALGVKAPYMTFYPAVMIATLMCGFPAGVLATFLSALLVSYFWNEPLYQIAIQDPADRLAMIAFILCSLVVAYLTDVLRRAEARGNAAEAQIKLLTEREHMNTMLQQSEERYRKVVEDQTEVISRFTADGAYTFVNDIFCRIFGKASEELVGSRWHPDVFPEDLSLVEESLGTMSLSHPVVVIENRIKSSSGDVRWMQFVNRGFFDTDGRLVETQSVGRDITDRKRVEEALRESEEKFRSIFDQSLDAIFLTEPDGIIIDANPAACKIFGMTVQEFCRLGRAGIIDQNDPRLPLALEERKQTGKVNTELTHIRMNGERFPAEVSSVIVPGDRPRSFVMAKDISERKRAEELMADLHQKLRDLSEHLQTVVEQEHLAIARDIHDELGQYLTILKLDLEWIENRIPADSGDLSERVREMRESIVQLTTTVQRIAADLRPPLLDNVGLSAAIEWYIDEFKKRSGLECFAMLNENIEPLSQKVSTAVMRIVQEGLTNVARHAKATEVTVSLCERSGNLFLEISDNGRGITPEQKSSPKAYGLMGMQERARICRGDMIISGQPGCGTMLQITIPLDAEEGAV